jgi:hypothetical protein
MPDLLPGDFVTLRVEMTLDFVTNVGGASHSGAITRHSIVEIDYMIMPGQTRRLIRAVSPT